MRKRVGLALLSVIVTNWLKSVKCGSLLETIANDVDNTDRASALYLSDVAHCAVATRLRLTFLQTGAGECKGLGRGADLASGLSLV
jgi:hypothetical protein